MGLGSYFIPGAGAILCGYSVRGYLLLILYTCLLIEWGTGFFIFLRGGYFALTLPLLGTMAMAPFPILESVGLAFLLAVNYLWVSRLNHPGGIAVSGIK